MRQSEQERRELMEDSGLQLEKKDMAAFKDELHYEVEFALR